jgi:ribonuclease P protein component
MRRSADFQQTVRGGVRAGRDSLVVHLMTRTDPGTSPVVGFVVSKAVGNAVVRNKVKRRLRAIVADRWDDLPGGTGVVVRALAPAATRPFSNLVDDYEMALTSALHRQQNPRTRR